MTMTGKTLRPCAAVARRWAAFGLCIVIVGLGMAAEEEAKSPEPLETELIGIRKAIINASIKFKNDIVGIQSQDSGAPATPAGQCCAKNLQNIEKRLRAAQRIIGDFDRCYTASGNEDMILAASIARADLIAFAKTAAAFAKAPNKAQAQGALQAMTRAYNLLRETAVSLEPCEGLESMTLPDESLQRSEELEQSPQPRED
jgi:hypothetical protein